MSMKRKEILVATDLSPRCDRAIDRALALARQWKAGVDILHVVEPGTMLDGEAEAGAARDHVLATLPDLPPDAEIILASGSAPETIAQTAEERGSALIVTGVARHNSVGDYVLGTAVDHIVRNATVPLLVVKQRPRKPYATMLVATDLSECSRDALMQAAALFPDVALHLVHAFHVPYEAWLTSDEVRAEIRDQAQRALDEFLNEPPLPETLRGRIQGRLDYGETAQVIARALQDTDADLAVFGTHGKSGFVHALMGSNAESLLSWVPVDTLMIREQS
jgi:nucleotide-binding universal stress UspA family protein